MSVKMSFELFREFIMKLFIFSNKLSTKLNSETKFYVDFKKYEASVRQRAFFLGYNIVSSIETMCCTILLNVSYTSKRLN